MVPGGRTARSTTARRNRCHRAPAVVRAAVGRTGTGLREGLRANDTRPVTGGSLRVCCPIHIGRVTAGACVERTMTLCDAGPGPLEVTGLRMRHRSRHGKLVADALPARLLPGGCLEVRIRYKAIEECPHRQALLVDSSDAASPVREIDITACTVWDDEVPRIDDGPPCADVPVTGRPARRA